MRHYRSLNGRLVRVVSYGSTLSSTPAGQLGQPPGPTEATTFHRVAVNDGDLSSDDSHPSVGLRKPTSDLSRLFAKHTLAPTLALSRLALRRTISQRKPIDRLSSLASCFPFHHAIAAGPSSCRPFAHGRGAARRKGPSLGMHECISPGGCTTPHHPKAECPAWSAAAQTLFAVSLALFDGIGSYCRESTVRKWDEPWGKGCGWFLRRMYIVASGVS